MKRLTLILLCAFAPICALCQKYSSISKNYESEFNKVIEQHDIYHLLDTTKKGDVAYFWDIVISNNDDYNKFMTAVTKNKPAARNTLSDIDETPYPSFLFKKFITDTIPENVKMILCGDNRTYNANFYILNSDEVNAFADPRGEICILTGLMDFFKKDRDIKILGILAHEMSHYLLQHSAVRKWKERRNQTLASIAVGLQVAADVTASVISASNGVESSSLTPDEVNGLVQNYTQGIVSTTYKHSREQELEADIIAVRYLEWIGYNPWIYVEGLYDMMAMGEGPGGYTSNHPTTRYRIAFLSNMLTKHKMKSVRELANELGITEEGWARMHALNNCLTELGYSSDYHIGAAYFQNVENDWEALWQHRLQGMLYNYMRNEGLQIIDERLAKLKAAYDLAN